MLSKSKLRLITKVAQLYHEKGYLQKQIAEELHLSQATISRLLKTADKQNIVKTSVSIPVGVYSDMEEEIEDRYGLKEDRKSTRLNSSHVSISYAVFCLKKKT